jgi:dTDP-4-amino-4,6-dideoxygalactose transaminase
MLTTSHPDLAARFRLLRQHGMSLSDTARHGAKTVMIESYDTTGYNFRMTDIQAAVGIEQLKKLPDFIAHRRMLNTAYREVLSEMSWLALPFEPDYARTNWQSYPVRLKLPANAPEPHESAALDLRNALMQHLLDSGIASKPGIMNAHAEAPYQNAQNVFDLPHSEAARANVILLPLFHTMTVDDVTDVCQCLKTFPSLLQLA